MLSRIRSWFDLSRVSSWRPGSGRHRRNRRRDAGGGNGGGSFNRDRRLSFPELSATAVAATAATTANDSAVSQQQPAVDQPVTMVAYHPKVQPEEVALPATTTTANSSSNTNQQSQNDRNSVQSHSHTPGLEWSRHDEAISRRVH